MLNKIVIFGGSFDPIHKGHIDIIRRLLCEFDKVIVVPNFMSPHKKNHEYADAQHRLKMIEIALHEEGLSGKNIELCTYEIDKEGTSYSIDTVRFLQEKNKNAQLYFCIGSENLAALDTWKSFDSLNKLVKFFVIPRPNFCHKIPPNINGQLAKFEGMDTSSSFIKALVALNEYSISSFYTHLEDTFCHISPSVLDYIRTQNLYPLHLKIGKIYHKFNFNKKRIAHIIGTIKLAICLAKLYNIDSHKAALAALLHDIAKYASFVEVKDSKLNINLAPLHPVVFHARIGEVIARQLLKIDDQDILNAIKYHTTKRADMSSLEKVVALADYLEENRDFENIVTLREAAFKDLDKAMYLVLEDMIKKLETKKREIYYMTKEAYEFYAKGK